MCQNEDEKCDSREIGKVGIILYRERISRCVEKKISQKIQKKGLLNYKVVGEFLADLKKQFGKEMKKQIRQQN